MGIEENNVFLKRRPEDEKWGRRNITKKEKGTIESGRRERGSE